MLSLLATQYSLSTMSLELYFSGCSGPHCKNCHNTESHDFNNGSKITAIELFTQIESKVNNSYGLVKQIMLFGGEPLDQPLDELTELVNHTNTLNLPIWLFTRYELSEVPSSLRIRFSYIKTGRYLEEFKGKHTQYGITLATSNQKIYKRGLDY